MNNPVLHLLIELAETVKAGNTELADLKTMAEAALGPCETQEEALLNLAYKTAAMAHAHGEGNPGEWKIDSNALVSLGDDPGAYVQAWVWIPEDWLTP